MAARSQTLSFLPSCEQPTVVNAEVLRPQMGPAQPQNSCIRVQLLPLPSPILSSLAGVAPQRTPHQIPCIQISAPEPLSQSI